MGLVDVYHAEHKARLARLGGIAKPAPVVAPRPVKPKPVEALKPLRVWFSVVEEIDPEPPKAPRVRAIQQACAKHYNITLHDILSERRSANFVRPRHVAMYLAKIMTPRSYPDIGRHFGRDHTVAIFAFRKIERLLETDGALQEDVAAIIKGIRG